MLCCRVLSSAVDPVTLGPTHILPFFVFSFLLGRRSHSQRDAKTGRAHRGMGQFIAELPYEIPLSTAGTGSPGGGTWWHGGFAV